MYFSKEWGAKSIVLFQLYVTLGVEKEKIRGMTILCIDNFGVIFAIATSTKVTTARRNRSHNLYYEQDQYY